MSSPDVGRTVRASRAVTADVILLTGATGFVGRQVLRSLVGRGRRVRVVVREGSLEKLEHRDSLESIVETRDLFAESADWWAQTCSGVTTVVHVAWFAEPGRYLEAPQNYDCLRGTLDLAKGAISAKVARFVGVGTCFEYDLSHSLLDVSTPLKPSTAYSIAKASLFSLLSHWLPANDIAFAWCRLFYLFGEGEDPRRLVQYIHDKIAKGEDVELTSGIQIRDFIDVKDAAEMIVEVALSRAAGPFNVCSGIPMSVRQISEKIADAYGRRDLLKFGRRPINAVDPMCVVGVRTPTEMCH